MILDLEDSVAPERKETARRLAAECLSQGQRGERQLFVRINPDSTGLLAADLAAVISAGPDGLMLLKAEARMFCSWSSTSSGPCR